MESAQIICQQLPAVRRSLRVAVVTESYPPEINGVAITTGHLVDGMRARGHEIQLIHPRCVDNHTTAEPMFRTMLQKGWSIPRTENLKMGLPAKQALARMWSLNRPDLVYVVTEGPLGWSALTAAVKLRIPVCSDFHTNFHSYSKHYGIGWLRKPVSGYLRRFHNKTHCTLVPTASLRDGLTGQGYLNVRLAGRGVDTRLFAPARRSDELRTQWGVTGNQTVALYVGRLNAEKNLSVAINAYLAMRAAEPDARLLMVGDGPERTALQAAHPEIIFAGVQTGEALAAHYASADVFLFPSTTETFGNVTLEALASGLAVVAYDYAAAAEHIHDGENGLLAEYDNERAFIRLATSLAGNPARIAALGSAARAASAQFDWEPLHDAFESTLREVIAQQQQPDLTDERLSA